MLKIIRSTGSIAGPKETKVKIGINNEDGGSKVTNQKSFTKKKI